MFTNLSTSFCAGLYNEEGRLPSKGNPNQHIDPFHPSAVHPRHHLCPTAATHAQPVTASNIPIKLLSFTGIPTCSLSSFTRCPGNHPPPSISPLCRDSFCCFWFFFIPQKAVTRFSCYGSVQSDVYFCNCLIYGEVECRALLNNSSCSVCVCVCVCVISRMFEKQSNSPHYR